MEEGLLRILTPKQDMDIIRQVLNSNLNLLTLNPEP